MNIFFTGSIRGGRSQQPNYDLIVRELTKYGAVFSRHVSDDALSHYGETSLSASEIFERERRALEKGQVVVAEVTTPSLGVGYLIACASAMQKRIIGLYCDDNTLKLSAIIKGDPNVVVHTYKTEADVKQVLKNVFDHS